MRQRTTFIQKRGDAVDPVLLRVSGATLVGPEIQARREDRLSLALDELPPELQSLLRDVGQFSITWSASRYHDAGEPWAARVPPGLHVFYTPGTGKAKDGRAPCEFLQAAFGNVSCASLEESFTAVGQASSSHPTALQYFHPLRSLRQFTKFVRATACRPGDEGCASQVERLDGAVGLELLYEGSSQTLRVWARWPYQEQSLRMASPRFRTEIGVLAEDTPPNLEPHEIGMSGVLTVLNPDSAPSPTLFSVPSRHRRARGRFSARFSTPTGLHPTLHLELHAVEEPWEDAGCALHSYLTLPRSVFPDKYQLADELFLASQNLSALRYVSQPVDLEAPEYVMKLWGSALLLELAPPPSPARAGQPWSVDIPLHLRYLSPSPGGYREIEVPYPAVFWACESAAATDFATNPFDQVNVGYDALFDSQTAFWHVDPHPEDGSHLVSTIPVPVLDLEKSQWISQGTTAAILAGFVWIVWKLLRGYGKSKNKNKETPREGNQTTEEAKKRR
ncbi:hypothetical protein VTK73DRAFT_857 [Phialemonium thermophilum]|uniref:Protein PBN1 n=1 Tax=Phialemonium thermophilum TaxID=223376 RepID=A0ABR3VU86_9PEZI